MRLDAARKWATDLLGGPRRPVDWDELYEALQVFLAETEPARAGDAALVDRAVRTMRSAASKRRLEGHYDQAVHFDDQAAAIVRVARAAPTGEVAFRELVAKMRSAQRAAGESRDPAARRGVRDFENRVDEVLVVPQAGLFG